MSFTFKQRYVGRIPDDSGSNPVGEAPLTIPAPCMSHQTDYKVFECNAEQKGDKIAAKMKHKLFMRKNGYNWKTDLNIPQNRIEKVKI